MDECIENLLTKLTKWYWSPQYPTTYVLPNGAGLGKIAMQSPGAFNLTWQRCGANLSDHVSAVNYFSLARTRLDSVLIDKQPLGSYATLMHPAEFRNFYMKHRQNMPEHVTAILDLPWHAKV